MKLFLFILCFCTLIFRSAAQNALCNFTLQIFVRSYPRDCNVQSTSVTLGNLNGSSTFNGLKDVGCEENGAAKVEAPCDFCLVIVNASGYGALFVTDSQGIPTIYRFDQSYEVIETCPAAQSPLCPFTLRIFEFTNGPRTDCYLQRISVTLANLNGSSTTFNGLKTSNCASDTMVEAPCDFCLVTVDALPSRLTGAVYVTDSQGAGTTFYFDYSYQVISICPGFTARFVKPLLSRREYFLVPNDTCMYDSRTMTLVCPSCMASGTCSYSVKVDAQTLYLCATGKPITVSVWNDYDRITDRGAGLSASWEASRSEFQQGLSFVGRCVDFCTVGVQIYDTSCSYQVNSVAVSGYNISRTFQVGETLRPSSLQYDASVYRTQCEKHQPYAVSIGSRTIYIPRGCERSSGLTPPRITCSC